MQHFRVGVAHLDHVCEKKRLSQLRGVLRALHNPGQIPAASARARKGKSSPPEQRCSGLCELPCVLLGDLNALTRNDYSDDQWARVARVREKSHWEAPVSNLTDTLRDNGMVDCWDCARSAPPLPLSTCRYDTRIDYIFLDKAMYERTRVHQCEVVPTRGATDHELVVAEFLPQESTDRQWCWRGRAVAGAASEHTHHDCEFSDQTACSSASPSTLGMLLEPEAVPSPGTALRMQILWLLDSGHHRLLQQVSRSLRAAIWELWD